MTYADTPGDGGTDIYVMDVDGTDRERLTTDDAYDLDPAWSPDGQRIVFNRSGNLVVANADGTNASSLTTNNGWSQPAWSPDGLTIAATRSTDCHVDPYGDPSCHVGIWVDAHGWRSPTPVGGAAELCEWAELETMSRWCLTPLGCGSPQLAEWESRGGGIVAGKCGAS